MSELERAMDDELRRRTEAAIPQPPRYTDLDLHRMKDFCELMQSLRVEPLQAVAVTILSREAKSSFTYSNISNCRMRYDILAPIWPVESAPWARTGITAEHVLVTYEVISWPLVSQTIKNGLVKETYNISYGTGAEQALKSMNKKGQRPVQLRTTVDGTSATHFLDEKLVEAAISIRAGNGPLRVATDR